MTKEKRMRMKKEKRRLRNKDKKRIIQNVDISTLKKMKIVNFPEHGVLSLPLSCCETPKMGWKSYLERDIVDPINETMC